MNILFLTLLQCLFFTVNGIKWTYNPGCNETYCSNANMLYVQAEQLQYLWSTDGGLAGAILRGNDTLNINWMDCKAEKKCIDVKTKHFIGFHFTKLVLSSSKSNDTQVVDLTKIYWRPIQTKNLTGSGPNLVFRYEADFMDVLVNVSVNESRMDLNPKLVLNENNTLFHIFVNMSRIPDISIEEVDNATLGIVAASGIDVIFHRNRTFDDEHTPALFEYNMLVDDLNERVYLQWRPVVYVDAERKTLALMRGDRLTKSQHSPTSLLRKLVGPNGNVTLLQLDVLPPDGTQYVKPEMYWTGVLGQGKPQTETLSTFGYVLTIAIVGLPILTMLLGSIFIIFKKHRAPPGQGYREI